MASCRDARKVGHVPACGSLMCGRRAHAGAGVDLDACVRVDGRWSAAAG